MFTYHLGKDFVTTYVLKISDRSSFLPMSINLSVSIIHLFAMVFNGFWSDRHL